MQISIVGVGAVGAVLGLHLERAGHGVEYVVRSGQRGRLRSLTLVPARGGAPTQQRDEPPVREVGDPGPAPDAVLVCVRGDQASAAVETALAACPIGRR